MNWSDISFGPSSRTLRQFAAIGAIFFGGLTIWQAGFRSHLTAGIVFAIAGAVIGLFGLIRPKALRWIYVGWMVAVFPIGWLLSRVMLAIMFFGIFTIVATIFRLLGRDALNRQAQPLASTYWKPKPSANEMGDYFRQF